MCAGKLDLQRGSVTPGDRGKFDDMAREHRAGYALTFDVLVGQDGSPPLHRACRSIAHATPTRSLRANLSCDVPE
jgi:hypothetical protein